MSIRSKLVLLVCLMTIVPAGAIGILSYSLSRAALTSKVVAEFEARRDLIALRLSNRLAELTKNADAWTGAAVMADVKINDNDLRIGTFLLNTKKSYPILKDISVFDLKGKVIASTNPAFDEKTNVQGMFPLDRGTAGQAVSGIGVQAADNYLVLPIHDVVSKDGTVAGVMLCEIDRTKLDEVVLAANAQLDDDQKVNVFMTAAGQTVSMLNEPTIGLTYDQLATAGGEVQSGFSERTVGGRAFVVSTAPVPAVMPGLSHELRLTVAQSDAVAFAAITRLATIVAVLASTLVVLFLAIGYVFARSLSQPILRLRELAEVIISSGDLSKRIALQPAHAKDEIGALGKSFNHLLEMVQEGQAQLEQYSKGLEFKVVERTKAIRTIMDHVSFGLFICDAHLHINEGYSKSAAVLLGYEPQAGAATMTGTELTKLLRLNGRAADHFATMYSQIFEADPLFCDIAVEQLPTRFTIGSQTIGLTGSVVLDDAGLPSGILFCVADISSLVRAEEEIQKNRSLIKMLGNRDSFRHFALDFRATVERIYRELAGGGDQAGVRHELHTLKGNCGVFGLVPLASLIHSLEDTAVIEEAGVRELETSLKTFLDDHMALLGVTYGVAPEDSYVVPAKLVTRTEERSKEVQDTSELLDLFTTFFYQIRMKRARTILGPIEDSFQVMATRLGKRVHIEVDGADTLVPQEHHTVLKNISHLLRNALDHGIEPAERRGAKSATGKVRLAIAAADGQLRIGIDDDGGGIDTVKLKRQALEKGLLREAELAKLTDEEACGLIFHDGMSTAEDVTDISGRGVGMGAVRAAVEAAHGSLKIASRLGQGTQVQILLPLSRGTSGAAAGNVNEPAAVVRPLIKLSA